MKKIIYYVLENSLDDPYEYFLRKHKNSLLHFDNKNNKYYFTSLFKTENEEISVKFRNINFDEILLKSLIDMINFAITEANKINKNEPIEKKDTIEKEISGIIERALQSYDCYIDKSYKTIFDFVAHIFINLLKSHPFANGNKRFALTYLIMSLRYFGYHLKWSKGVEMYLKVYKSFLEICVINLSSINGFKTRKEFETEETKIVEFIKKNSVIALEWR